MIYVRYLSWEEATWIMTTNLSFQSLTSCLTNIREVTHRITTDPMIIISAQINSLP